MPGIWSESTMFVIYNRLGGISSTLSSLSSCKEFQDKLFLLFFSKVGWAFLGLLKHTLVIGPCTFSLGHFLFPRACAFPLGLFYIFSIWFTKSLGPSSKMGAHVFLMCKFWAATISSQVRHSDYVKQKDFLTVIHMNAKTTILKRNLPHLLVWVCFKSWCLRPQFLSLII